MRSIFVFLIFLIFTSWLFGQNGLQPENGASNRISQSIGAVLSRPVQNLSSEENSTPAMGIPGADGPDDPTDEPSSDEGRVQFRVSVNDADGNAPIELARVALSQNGRYVTYAVTNPAGQARFRDIKAGDLSHHCLVRRL